MNDAEKKQLEAAEPAIRLAAAVADTGFWRELSERMDIRDAADKELVKPRQITH